MNIEHYGSRTLHPLDYPIQSYEDQMVACKGMYDCVPLGTKEHFGGHFLRDLITLRDNANQERFLTSFNTFLFILFIVLFLSFLPEIYK